MAISDISAHAELEETLRRQLTHDQLTSVLSWYGLNQTLANIELERTSRPDLNFACLHINIDNFSAINDVFGRYVGDEVLLEVVRRIRSLIAEADGIVARPGADDFVVLIRSQSLEAAKANAERLVTAIGEKAVTHEGTSCSITASVGIAFLISGLPANEAVDQAGRACQAAKRAGGDRLQRL
ncbi:MAG: GGDEF domain-containing protein [Burkholderiaceae bacterium]